MHIAKQATYYEATIRCPMESQAGRGCGLKCGGVQPHHRRSEEIDKASGLLKTNVPRRIG